MKAKKTSLIGMIIGGICLSILLIIVLIKLIKEPAFTLTINNAVALILIGVAPSVPFCPIYVSIILDKLMLIKNGNKIVQSE